MVHDDVSTTAVAGWRMGVGLLEVGGFAPLREKRRRIDKLLSARMKRPTAVELVASRSTAKGIWGVDASNVHTVAGSEAGGVGVRRQHTNCLYFMFMTHLENEMRAWYVTAAVMVRLFFYQENKVLWTRSSLTSFGKLFFLPAEVFILCGATGRTGKGANSGKESSTSTHTPFFTPVQVAFHWEI